MCSHFCESVPSHFFPLLFISSKLLPYYSFLSSHIQFTPKLLIFFSVLYSSLQCFLFCVFLNCNALFSSPLCVCNLYFSFSLLVNNFSYFRYLLSYIACLVICKCPPVFVLLAIFVARFWRNFFYTCFLRLCSFTLETRFILRARGCGNTMCVFRYAIPEWKSVFFI